MSVCEYNTITYQEYALPRHPADGEDSFAFNAVIITAVERATHAKVRDLDGVVAADQTVTRGQVSVNHVQCLQVLHARGNLCGHVDQATVATNTLL